MSARPPLRYLSVCSGIEAATVAWHPLGWRPAAFAEVDAFPCAVLAHHSPDVPNLGDMTRYAEWPDAAIDVLVGGTPCQTFSVAGLRAGLDDPRGNLMLTFGAIARRYRPRWLVWENVPGVLSSNRGRDFGSFLWLLGELGYGFAYRVLDAQYFGLAQRRKRVFVVGCLGDWRRAAAVLSERSSLRGDPPPSRQARQSVAGTLAGGARASGGYSEDDIPKVACPEVSPALKARDHKGPSSDGDGDGAPLIALNARQDPDAWLDRTGPLEVDGGSQAIAFKAFHFTRAKDGAPSLVTPPLSADADKGDQDTLVAVSIAENQHGEITTNDVTGALAGKGGKPDQGYAAAQIGMCVRRLTPRECERLQGFPDGYTAVPIGLRAKPAKDGPRYKALGNSMAVPVMRWIGERIAFVDSIATARAAGG